MPGGIAKVALGITGRSLLSADQRPTVDRTGRNHIAKDIATTSHVAVGVEGLKAKAMSSTAEGTLEFPGVIVAQKQGIE